MQLEVKVQMEGFKDLLVALQNVPSKMPRHLRAAVNKTVKTVRVQVAKELGKVMHLKSNYDADFKKAKTLKRVIKAKSMATEDNPTAIVRLDAGYPFPLKYYDAKPYTKKVKKKKKYLGVTYRVQPSKMAKNRSVLHDAFMVSRYGHNVYSRQGETRKPLTKVVGPKPGDYYQEIGAKEIAVKTAGTRLPIEIRRRVRAILLEKQGVLKLKASR